MAEVSGFHGALQALDMTSTGAPSPGNTMAPPGAPGAGSDNGFSPTWTLIVIGIVGPVVTIFLLGGLGWCCFYRCIRPHYHRRINGAGDYNVAMMGGRRVL